MCARSSQSANKKSFSCVFSSHVVCSFRKSERSGIMNRCLRCPHYKKFMCEMDEEDAREGAEIEDIWKNPEKYGYSRE
jgi:hypothetical protein